MRTYSRQRTYGRNAAEPPSKRRRILEPDTSDAIFHSDAVAATDAPSSPVHDGLTGAGASSDDILLASTPPSSPPPSLPPARRPTFSFFARRTAKTPATSTSALRERSPNGASSLSSSPKKASSPHSAASAKPTTAATNPVSPPQPSKKADAKTKAKPPRRLTQLRLDLSLHTPVSAQKTCSACGMAYVPTNDEDAALHKAFHAMSDGGVELGRAFVRGLPNAQVVWRGGDGDDRIVSVGRRDGVAARNRVLRVLEVVRSELGAVEIGAEELWSVVEDNVERVREKDGVEVEKSKGKARESASGCEDRFRAFLYVRGSKCIGLCLAERIEEAYRVLPDAPGPVPAPEQQTPASTKQQGKQDEQQGEQHRSTTPTFSQKPQDKTPASPTTTPETAPAPTPALSNTTPSTTNNLNLSPIPSKTYDTGISRIWTSASHRRRGVAHTLLDAVAARRGVEDGGWSCSCNGGKERGRKEGIAFSQPTEAGGRLARRWFGGWEWGVYW